MLSGPRVKSSHHTWRTAASLKERDHHFWFWRVSYLVVKGYVHLVTSSSLSSVFAFVSLYLEISMGKVTGVTDPLIIMGAQLLGETSSRKLTEDKEAPSF